ncbi:hypothetical protein RJ55_07645 [Drechmeria coniospora]|nr:hypothetical protein RJ55_07645 [Drechmeria coniospora]
MAGGRLLLPAIVMALSWLAAGHPAGRQFHLKLTGTRGCRVAHPSTILIKYLVNLDSGSGIVKPSDPTRPDRPSPGKSTGGQGLLNISQSEAPVKLFGVSYAPYRADHRCKTAKDIQEDFRHLAGKYSVVRIYGTDCEQVGKAYPLAKAHGMKLFLGIWAPAAVREEAGKIVSGVKGDWSIVHTISVGNELVNNGQASAKQMVSAIKTARSILRSAGYRGPVVTVDTAAATRAHPVLCEESDYCAINAHAFFDSTASAPRAGKWLRETVSSVRSVLSTPKEIIVTETGWPTRGDINGVAIPGMDNQKAALDSIRREFAATPGRVILFSAFNDMWKRRESATFNAEQFWGIDGAVAFSDL